MCQLSEIITVSAIIVGILPILSRYYPFKESPFQVLFRIQKESHLVIIRNISSNVAFIDRIYLHRYPEDYEFGIIDITDKFRIINNTKVCPGESVYASFSLEEIEKIVLRCYEKC